MDRVHLILNVFWVALILYVLWRIWPYFLNEIGRRYNIDGLKSEKDKLQEKIDKMVQARGEKGQVPHYLIDEFINREGIKNLSDSKKNTENSSTIKAKYQQEYKKEDLEIILKFLDNLEWGDGEIYNDLDQFLSKELSTSNWKSFIRESVLQVFKEKIEKENHLLNFATIKNLSLNRIFYNRLTFEILNYHKLQSTQEETLFDGLSRKFQFRILPKNIFKIGLYFIKDSLPNFSVSIDLMELIRSDRPEIIFKLNEITPAKRKEMMSELSLKYHYEDFYQKLVEYIEKFNDAIEWFENDQSTQHDWDLLYVSLKINDKESYEEKKKKFNSWVKENHPDRLQRMKLDQKKLNEINHQFTIVKQCWDKYKKRELEKKKLMEKIENFKSEK